MKMFLFTSSIFLSLILHSCQWNRATEANIQVATTDERTNTTANDSSARIQVAILLDTSSSMEGLIDQTKSRLWNIVNTLTTLKYEGQQPQIEIALYEYGNNNLTERSGFIRQLTPLTTDLDLISEMLFSLNIWGGSEHCGEVIGKAVNALDWGSKQADMKLIYIAGNESFDQGEVRYRKAISDALENGIFVNTIYCGDYESGISELWKDGADCGKGKYFNINSDAVVRHITTPYDEQISRCNVKLNDTYVAYGSMADEKKTNQMTQDRNAEKMSSSNYTERVVSKSKGAYKNSSWDLVDKVKTNDDALTEIKQDELPAELQNKSKEELAKIVARKAKERETIQNEIADLAKKRQEYIDAELQKSDNDQDDLGNAINSSIMTFASAKGYVVSE